MYRKTKNYNRHIDSGGRLKSNLSPRRGRCLILRMTACVREGESHSSLQSLELLCHLLPAGRNVAPPVSSHATDHANLPRRCTAEKNQSLCVGGIAFGYVSCALVFIAHYPAGCGSPIRRTSSAKRGSVRMGSSRKSVFNPNSE